MSESCRELHQLVAALPKHDFTFDPRTLPLNGVYLMFEKGESAHGTDRIVCIGSHTRLENLPRRLAAHFHRQSWRQSILRRHVGRALLSKAKDSFLEEWSSRDRPAVPNKARRRQVEMDVTEELHSNFRFAVVACEEDRLLWEKALISIVSRCDECAPSSEWLGLSSPKDKIRDSGLWLVQYVGRPLPDGWDFTRFAVVVREPGV